MLVEQNHTAQTTPEIENKSVAASSPRYLTSDTYLLLHTRNAQALFKGKWRRNGMGLLQFASLIQKIWQAVKQGDPYAEWYLMKTYDAIEALKTDIRQLEQHCQEKITQLRGFDVQLFHHDNPERVLLKFSTPFAYMAAQLLADFDYVFRQAYTLQRLGVMLELDRLPIKVMLKLRRLFTLPLQWKYTGITRKDIVEKNQKAEEVKKAMGTLPPAILQQEIKFSFLPKVSSVP